MKELSIEQKAKAYDKAIEVAREYWNSPRTCIDIDVLPELFPEIKEIDDEEIRKAMIKYFTNGKEYLSLTPYSREDYIAWLEKQCEQKYTKKDIDDAYLKGVCDAKHELEKQGEKKPINIVTILDDYFATTPKEQQALWRKEIEQAVISGGYNGLGLAKDPRYKENLEVKEVDLEKEFENYMDKYNGVWVDSDYIRFAKHFFELGLKAQKL